MKREIFLKRKNFVSDCRCKTKVEIKIDDIGRLIINSKETSPSRRGHFIIDIKKLMRWLDG